MITRHAWHSLLVGSALAAGAVAASDGDWPTDPLPDTTIDVHFTVPSYAGCQEHAVDDAALACAWLNDTYLDFGQPNFAWVMVGAVPDGDEPDIPPGISGLQFGIEYDPGFVLLGDGWTLCNGGSELPEYGWPKSGYGNAVTWPGDCYEVHANADGLTRVGYFLVRALDEAVMSLVEDPRLDQARVVYCDGMEARVCETSFGEGYSEEGLGSGTRCGDLCLVGRTPIRETTWGSLKSVY